MEEQAALRYSYTKWALKSIIAQVPYENYTMDCSIIHVLSFLRLHYTLNIFLTKHTCVNICYLESSDCSIFKTLETIIIAFTAVILNAHTVGIFNGHSYFLTIISSNIRYFSILHFSVFFLLFSFFRLFATRSVIRSKINLLF